MLMRNSQSTNVAIIGAGPYGLATAAHLLKAGVSTRIFGKPMGAWTGNMPKGMFLKSAFEATSISAPEAGSSLVDYCIETGIEAFDDWHPIPIDVFASYGLHFQKRHVRGVEDISVQQISKVPEGFRVSLANGEAFTARSVVAATGHLHFTHWPAELRGAGGWAVKAGVASHTSQHDDFTRFAGRTVAVVGAGQSALESAVLLHEAGAKAHLLVRDPQILWGGPPIKGDSLFRRLFKPKTAFGPGWSHVVITEMPQLISQIPAAWRLALVRKAYGPSGGWWLRQRFEGKIDVALATRVEQTVEASGRVMLRLRTAAGEESSLVVDHVLAATGYQVDVDAADYLDPEIRTGLKRVPGSGSPKLSRNFESSIPGLYFVGLSSAATFGPLQRFVHGTDFAARTVSRPLVTGAA